MGVLKALKSKQKSWKKIVSILIILAIVPTVFLLIQRLEGEPPKVEFKLQSKYIGKHGKIDLFISDHKSGVKKVWVSIFKDGSETVIFKENYQKKNIFKAGSVKTKSIEVNLSPSKLKINDGLAILRIAVWDHSWRLNKTYFEKNVVIDTTPPEVDVLSRTHRIYQGGTGLVIYQIPEKGTKNGVVVGDNFFPGYPGNFKNKNIHMAFFALNHKQGPKTKIYLKVTDQAQNTRLSGFHHKIIQRLSRKDNIRLSDNFLKWKLPQFDTDKNRSLIEQFLYVNRKIREKNAKKITEVGKNTINRIMWNDKFLRLPSASNRARFSDYRSYYYKGRIVDHQYHLGIDLASNKHAPIPASNSGIVVLVKKIGIYGKTVVIDHGFGLFTTYSHLSMVFVKKGKHIKKGEIIGRTGITGMTGGDHLHYGMFVNNIFVNPIEWWDTKWIKNNILFKINQIESK